MNKEEIAQKLSKFGPVCEGFLEDFQVKPIIMKSAFAEAAKNTYHMVKGKHGQRWLYSSAENSADNIYVEGGEGSQGFGGSTLEFKLVSGEIVSLKGPWHSNPESLFCETGLDLRDKHATFGVIGQGRNYEYGLHSPIITGVLYKDQDWIIGSFKRVEYLAKEIAKELEMDVMYYSQSMGGSSCSLVKFQDGNG
jgi:hypothetical protein